MPEQQISLGVDIGGTFTDVVLEGPGGQVSTKVLTTYDAPENAILDGIGKVCTQAGVLPGAVGRIIHGTTLGGSLKIGINGLS